MPVLKMAKTKVKKKTGGDACSALNCSNARYKFVCEKMSFFRFPPDEERCKVWVQNTRRKDLLGKSAKHLSSGGYKLCSDHFELNQFNRPAEKDRLVWNGIPTIFSVPNPPPTVTLKRKPKERHADHPAKKIRMEAHKGDSVASASFDDKSESKKLTVRIPSNKFSKNMDTGCLSRNPQRDKSQGQDPEVNTGLEVKVEIDIAEEPSLSKYTTNHHLQAPKDTTSIENSAGIKEELMPEPQDTCSTDKDNLWIKQEPDSDDDVAADDLGRQTAAAQDMWKTCMQNYVSCADGDNVGRAQHHDHAITSGVESEEKSRVQSTPRGRTSTMQLTSLTDADSVDSHSGQTSEIHSPVQHHQKEAVNASYSVSIQTQTHSCELCSETFALESQLEKHMQEHGGPRFYTCQKFREFPRLSELTRHFGQHVRGKSFACEACNATFRNQSGLKKHMLKHAELTTYKCPYCSAICTWEKSLKKHMQIHKVEESSKAAETHSSYIYKIGPA